MGNDNQHIQVEFHARARAIYFVVLDEFGDSVKEVNRHKEEYRFVQIKERYTHTLKQQLEDIANTLIRQNQHCRQLSELQHGLQQSIKDYLHDFLIKSRSM